MVISYKDMIALGPQNYIANKNLDQAKIGTFDADEIDNFFKPVNLNFAPPKSFDRDRNSDAEKMVSLS